MTTEMPSAEVVEACAAWQTDHDRSSRIRAAARVISGVPHYVHADAEIEHEAQARTDHATLVHASTLMTLLAKTTPRTVDEWRAEVGIEGSGCAAAAVVSTDPATDAEIVRVVTKPGATLNMPLWGFGLDEGAARTSGPRFLFRLQGRFSAVPAWRHSGRDDDATEMIGGGGYRVLGTSTEGDLLVVDLKQLAVPMYDAHDLDQLLAAAPTTDPDEHAE